MSKNCFKGAEFRSEPFQALAENCLRRSVLAINFESVFPRVGSSMVEQRPFKALVVGSSPTCNSTVCFLGRFYPVNQLPERLCRQSRFRKNEAEKVSSRKGAENGETDRKTRKVQQSATPFPTWKPFGANPGNVGRSLYPPDCLRLGSGAASSSRRRPKPKGSSSKSSGEDLGIL